ncbi:MAG: beta-lactamase family protein [Flavobacteriales bacterium]|nr:beta-lactamase family protein [Flavobacteriales bacterium]
MKKKLQYLFLVGATLIFCQCKAQQIITTNKIEAINSFVAKQTEKGFSGSVLISENNNILFSKGYGFANREQEIPNNENTLYEIGSITKLFTVIAILQLADNGQLSLNDKLSKYFGKFDKPKNQATINHLLIHTAGLVPRGHELNYNSRKEFVESVKKTPPESIPGEKYRYTNAGYTMLAAIIEEVSKMSYEDYLTKNIFIPLNLTNTTTTFEIKDSIQNFADGYSGKTLDSLKIYKTPDPVWGDRGPGGILINVNDLHKFLVGMENKNLINNEYLQKMYAEQIEGEAYGFHVLNKPDIGKVLARGGGLPQFESQIAWYKEKNVKVILLINNRLRLRQPVWYGIEEILFKKL